jgi:hypothetical protein
VPLQARALDALDRIDEADLFEDWTAARESARRRERRETRARPSRSQK